MNPTKVDSIIQQGKEVGLSNLDALNENLRSGTYIPVLNAIWSERDRSRRLEWLRSHQSAMHAPLMFEQSIAEFTTNPTVETIIRISLPLILAASFRVMQDSKCSMDPSVCDGDAANRMQITYLQSLKTQTVKHLKKTLDEISSENERAINTAINERILAVARLSIVQDLPSPNWIGYHGTSVFINGNIQMHPDSKFKELRDQCANDEIQKRTSSSNPM